MKVELNSQYLNMPHIPKALLGYRKNSASASDSTLGFMQVAAALSVFPERTESVQHVGR